MTISALLQHHGIPAAEADELERVRVASRPFAGATVRTFPRAGVRRRSDGRFQVSVWKGPEWLDPVQGGIVDTLQEGGAFGEMIIDYARAVG